MKKNIIKILTCVITIFMFMILLNPSDVYADNHDDATAGEDAGAAVGSIGGSTIGGAAGRAGTAGRASSLGAAAGATGGVGRFITPPIGGGTDSATDLKTIFTNVLNIVQTIMIMFSTLYLIYAGFMFVTAKGDPTRLKKAKDSLLWGLIGVALILTAEVLAYGIGDTVKEVFK